MKLMDLGNLLSICIPTYNRGEYLRQCLDSLIPWAKENGFPIYIVDDNSADHTQQVILDARQKYGGIHYQRNSENLGMYLNTLKVVSTPGTEYVWMMGDDDRVITQDLHSILEYIENGADYIVLNSIACNSTMESVKRPKIIRCDKDLEYAVGMHEKLLSDLSTWAYHGFMSSMIARKDMLVNESVPYAEEAFQYYKNNWLPLIMFYRGIVGKKGIFRCKPLIENRADSRHLKKTFWELSVIGRVTALESLESSGYSRNALREAVGLGALDIAYFALNSKKVNREVTLCNKFVKDSDIISRRFKVITFLIDHLPFFFVGIVAEIIEKLKE